MSAPNVVYRAFAENDQLLYVGLSMNAAARLAQHQRDKPWWTDVDRVEFEHFEDRATAAEAEARAIAGENPVHNVARPGVPVSAEVREQRRLDREARKAAESEEPEMFSTRRRILCGNCGERPAWLLSGVLIADQECTACGCATLALSPQEDVA
jgi:hypothetical protein